MNEAKRPCLCVPICERRADALPQAMERAAAVADMLELRLDFLMGDELSRASDNLSSLIESCPRPVILTLRSVEQGGQHEIDSLNRTIFWVENLMHGKLPAAFADIEMDLALLFHRREAEEGKSRIDWSHVICSHHDFAGVPADLESIYKQMSGTPARILKIAVRANDITDCIPVFRLLERARLEGREMIAIAMGQAGIMTRILGPAHGAFLTYGSLDAEHASAPGQLSAADLSNLYRVKKLHSQTAIMGLVGLPVTHSFSPQIHNAAFAASDMDAVYIPFEVHDLPEFMRRMVHKRSREMEWNLCGLSVTAPHKSAIMEYLDELDQSAQEIGAVNTVRFEGDALKGYNTDAAGLLAPLEEKIGPLRDLKIAIIGAGGAARSALWGLSGAGAQVSLFARHLERGKALAGKFKAGCEALEGASFAGFDVVINATPLGTRGLKEDETPAIAGQLHDVRLAYDLVYNPARTRFLREAEEAGCETLGGLSMLVAQAAAQFKLWTGRDAPLELMHEAALRTLGVQ